MKTGIIIPCYNEEKRLNQEAFVRFAQEHEDYHLCFVNDGSKDRTLNVLNRMRAQAPSGISIVDVKKNSGKATAVRAGARYLYTLDEIAYIGFMDADLSTDFRDFKDLVTTLKRERVSMVFGSRNSGGGGIERNFMRSLFSNFIKHLLPNSIMTMKSITFFRMYSSCSRFSYIMNQRCKPYIHFIC